MVNCPRCNEPYDGKCWHCGFNTDNQEDYYYDQNTRKMCTATELLEKLKNETPEGRVKLSGGSSSYYELPEGCKELQDLIEYKNMNFARGNVFKAAYRLGEKPGTEQIYDWEKIIWFANREIQRLKGVKE